MSSFDNCTRDIMSSENHDGKLLLQRVEIELNDGIKPYIDITPETFADKVVDSNFDINFSKEEHKVVSTASTLFPREKGEEEFEAIDLLRKAMRGKLSEENAVLLQAAGVWLFQKLFLTLLIDRQGVAVSTEDAIHLADLQHTSQLVNRSLNLKIDEKEMERAAMRELHDIVGRRLVDTRLMSGDLYSSSDEEHSVEEDADREFVNLDDYAEYMNKTGRLKMQQKRARLEQKRLEEQALKEEAQLKRAFAWTYVLGGYGIDDSMFDTIPNFFPENRKSFTGLENHERQRDAWLQNAVAAVKSCLVPFQRIRIERAKMNVYESNYEITVLWSSWPRLNELLRAINCEKYIRAKKGIPRPSHEKDRIMEPFERAEKYAMSFIGMDKPWTHTQPWSEECTGMAHLIRLNGTIALEFSPEENPDVCEICGDNFSELNSQGQPHVPVALGCGHAYGKSCLLNWSRKLRICSRRCDPRKFRLIFDFRNNLMVDDWKLVKNQSSDDRSVLINPAGVL